MSLSTLISVLRYERSVNRREFKAQFVLLAFRITQYLMRDIKSPRKISYPFVLMYRLISEWGLGIELRPTTQVGRGLRIFHGTGLVVNPDAVLGDDVILRNGVVIGNRGSNLCPVIQDRVEFGANAIAIGGISIGHDATIGAGAVVVKSLLPGAVAVGNPARVLPATASGESK